MHEVNALPIQAEPTIENEQKSSAIKILEQAQYLTITNNQIFDALAP